MSQQQPQAPDAPQLSVILVTTGDYAVSRPAVRNLTRQTGVALELVLVGPPEFDAGLSDADRTDLAAFAAWRHVDVPVGTSFDNARAAGVRAAGAPIIAFTEDHAFPRPGWAAAIVRAFDHRWTGVGPVVENANPGSSVSWANILLEYGPWMPPARGGAWPHIPGHNSAYRRDALLALGDRLPVMIEAESVLHWALGAEGHAFALAPDARTRHVNFSRLYPSLQLRFHGSRQFASRRCGRWPAGRRAAFAAAAPLIPLVRLARVVGLPVLTSRPGLLVRVLPALAISLVVSAAGELVGYVTARPGRATTAYLTDIEFDRERFLRRADRAHPV
jgi:Glycosyl transferase family 2